MEFLLKFGEVNDSLLEMLLKVVAMKQAMTDELQALDKTHTWDQGEMDSSGHNSTAHSNTPSSTRCKSDPAWDYVTEGRVPDGEKTLTCLYCGKTIKGGGINRMKQHLAGKFGEPMFDSAIAIGPGFKVPTYHEVRVPLLSDSKKELQLFIDSVKSTWADSGCTIMGDGWADGRHRTLINFLVYCPRGITFVKSVDASDVVKDAPLLFKLFEEIIEWVGASNIVHMVIDNGANYVAAGRLVSETYKNSNWSPCAVHCLNLVLSDISKLNHVKEFASRASSVTRFIYNRPWLIAWLRKRKGWTEIVRPGATCFATTFIALLSIQKHMHDLKALVTSKDFVDSRHAKDKKEKEVVAIILDSNFSNDYLTIVKIVEPLMRLLRIVDGDKKPSMGYAYEGIHFNNMKNYDPVDIESIDKTEFWIVEDEEEPPLLDFDELEQMLYPEKDNGEDVVLEVGDDIDLGSFGDVNMDD
ncbi:uncharacterized protein LOC114302858 [Camellia sinensis]|uniref:uncharacterized protein LOC114302858 n=1 Tax=Camellia sinensis TaxID=4442 RepID=UPI001036A456|nr:uncharacterized protein LOC114302858 [Camellia sinensis]